MVGALDARTAWRTSSRTGSSAAGARSGRSFGGLFSALPDLETTVERVAATAHLAAVEWRMAGHFTGAPFMDLEATGRRIDIRGIDLLEIEDGEIVGNTAYYDGASFARQVGMLPSEGSGAERAMKGAFNAVTKMRRRVG